MSTQTYRKISPSMCIRPGTDKQQIPYKLAIPKRPSLGNSCKASDRFEASISMPFVPIFKVRFADEPAIDRASIIRSITSTQSQSLTEGSTTGPSRQFSLGDKTADLVDNKHSPDFAHQSPKPDPTPIVKALTREPAKNSFADSETIIDVPDLCLDENPFRDADSVSSYSTGPSTVAEPTESIPEVHIVDFDASLALLTPSITPPLHLDFKEEQSYFVQLEQFYHPDMARQHFQERKGHLWTAAIGILMNHYLHPVDLTESEFANLVLSQGNATSEWLRINARKICSRVVRHKMDLHRQLTEAGLPADRLTEDFLDTYDTMGDFERDQFMNYFERLAVHIKEIEKELNLDGAMKETYDGMSLIEKFDFGVRYRANALELQNIEKELAEIEAFTTAQNCSSTESFPSNLPALSHQATPRKELKEISDIFCSTADTASGRIGMSWFADFGSKLGLSKPGESFSSSAATPKQGHISYDARINDTNTTEPSRNLRQFPADDALKSCLARVKSTLLNRIPHPIRALKRKDSQARLIRKSDDSAKADSESMPETFSTARKAIIASPTIVQITPSSSMLDIKIAHQGEPSQTREDSGLGMSYEDLPGPDTPVHKSTVRCEKPASDKIQAQLSGSLDVPAVDDVVVDFPGQQLDNAEIVVKKESGLTRRASCWALRPPHRRQLLELTNVEPLPNQDGSESNGEDAKSKRTLRKMISTIFETHKNKGTLSGADIGCTSFGRKVFSRKSLPEWGFST